MKINPSYIYNKAAEVKPRTLATETGLPNNSAGLSPLPWEEILYSSLAIQIIQIVAGNDTNILKLQEYSAGQLEID